MLEFSLIFPLILLVMLMFIELGRVVYFYSALNNAVREGARFGTVCPSADYGIGEACLTADDRLAKIRAKVIGYAIWLPLRADQISVYCDEDPSNNSNPCGEYISVKADLQVAPMAAFIARILGAGTTYDLTAESTMQMSPWGSQ
jgi:Flp pilus assembly protein TadG